MIAVNGTGRACALIACLAITLALAPGLARGEEETCTVVIKSEPAGGQIFLDGREVGKTPKVLGEQTVGDHDVRIVLAGHAEWSKRVALTPGISIVNARLVGSPDASAPPPSEDKPDELDELDEPDRPAPEPPASAQPSPDDTTSEPDEPDEPEDSLPTGTNAPIKIPKSIDIDCPWCKGLGIMDTIGCVKCGALGTAPTRPRRTTCPDCNGTARVRYNCPQCEGGGDEKTTKGESRPCRLCKGKGVLPCTPCKGTGKVPRPNPARVSYETQPCQQCSGTGCQLLTECNRCGGKGNIRYRYMAGRTIYTYWLDCSDCGKKGERPTRCQACSSKGYTGGATDMRPCLKCGATGYQYPPCRFCRGRGWVKARTR